MQKISQIIFISASITLAACGAKQQDSLAGKKTELEKLQKQQIETADKIKQLQTDIAKLDTSATKNDIAKLVSTTALTTQNFTHYIDLQGRIDADNISYVTPRLGGGQVKELLVKKGDFVKKGQLLVKLDNAVIKKSYTAAKQSLETIKTQLNFAKDIYNRQNNLWKQGIGTEVQLLTAKNNVETLTTQLKASEDNLKTMQEQVDATNVYSDVDGIADEVNVKVGEFFNGQGQIKIVNTQTLKAVVDVPENYSDRVNKNSKLIIVLPDINKTYNNISVSFLSKTINALSRSFTLEGRLPYDGIIRPNQVAQVKIEDYAAKNTITVPVNTVGTDEKGKFVYIAIKEGNKLLARKKQITVGELYNDLIEVKTGLNAGDQLITDGYQNLYDGQALKTSDK
ncbi:MAG: efflux RND transporter periplasmic adaptor subunit [Bacteroidetes bacterium]|nr:efflux RND transporter periplasmic adaptor subunit [Bacteroidota bacterium]MBS1671233.1 efflux RND transporter periplasmic adaptor subunit [Bacteroidota bacterium]